MIKMIFVKNVMIVLLFTLCYSASAQIINFSDPNFKNALVNTMCVDNNGDGLGDVDGDLNNDNEIDTLEALAIERLVIKNNNISSLSGIEYFTNLSHLNCQENQI